MARTKKKYNFDFTVDVHSNHARPESSEIGLIVTFICTLLLVLKHYFKNFCVNP